MASGHSRKSSVRAALPRRTTRGPLDADEYAVSKHHPDSADDVPSPLSASELSATLSPVDSLPAATSAETPVTDEPKPSQTQQLEAEAQSDKKLSFLLDASIYHPLSQIEIPLAFRKPLPSLHAEQTSIDQVFARLESLISECHFVGAAHLSALALTSGAVNPYDASTIFRLLSVRYSCLELSGFLVLAAQEAKALEDLSSTFYYHDDVLPDRTAASDEELDQLIPKHVIPFDLRLQALRLQGIGFSDPRRGVSSLYDIGLECRDHLSSSQTTAAEKHLWNARLEEVGVRVVNALIEMNDLDCAYRTLESMKPKAESGVDQWFGRMILLCIKMGKVNVAEQLLRDANMDEMQKDIYGSLVQVANGQYEEAAHALNLEPQNDVNQGVLTLAKQNLAVTLLYTGQISDCRSLLREMATDGKSYQTLINNLATVYELSSESARDLKLAMTNVVAAKSARAYTNADFKL